MIEYMGTTTMLCPDCTGAIVVAFDYAAGWVCQPTKLRRLHHVALKAHARERPILHPRVLPEHHHVGR